MSNKQQFLLYGLITLLLVIIAILATLQFRTHSDVTVTATSDQITHTQIQDQDVHSESSAASSEVQGITSPNRVSAIKVSTAEHTQNADQQVEDSVNAALAAVQAAKIATPQSREKLNTTVDSQYHSDLNIASSPTHYGLKPVKTAPAFLKNSLSNLHQSLGNRLMQEWGRNSPDQVGMIVEGWKDDGTTVIYRTAWNSDRSQCTWYVMHWNKARGEVEQEGFKPC